jgi:nucleotide-binding universal stress UspA family protein
VGVDAGTDAQSPVDAVLDFAFAEASLRGARLRAVQGWDAPPVWPSMGVTVPMIPGEELQSAEAAQLTEVMRPWREKFPGVEVVEQARVGGGAAALVDASATADLVVIGRRRRPHGAGMRLGSVAHAVIHHAQAPVAVVPHP